MDAYTQGYNAVMQKRAAMLSPYGMDPWGVNEVRIRENIRPLLSRAHVPVKPAGPSMLDYIKNNTPFEEIQRQIRASITPELRKRILSGLGKIK